MKNPQSKTHTFKLMKVFRYIDMPRNIRDAFHKYIGDKHKGLGYFFNDNYHEFNIENMFDHDYGGMSEDETILYEYFIKQGVEKTDGAAIVSVCY